MVTLQALPRIVTPPLTENITDYSNTPGITYDCNTTIGITVHFTIFLNFKESHKKT